ncbi:MAG: HAD family hydrolase [Polyangiales bacterium]
MLSRPHAILFDLDGTLLDSLASIATAMNEALAALSLPEHPIEAYKHFVGDGVRVLAERVLPASEQHRIEALLAEYKPRYRARQLEAPPYEGAHAMLEALASRGISLSVLTNKPDDLAGEIVRSLFASIPFAVIRGELAGGTKKPDPTQALEIARAVDVAPSQCWFVGDTPTDVRTARNAGMPCVAVLWGFRGREELSSSGATVFIEHPRELVALYDTSGR